MRNRKGKRSIARNTLVTPASTHSKLKWKKPTPSRISFQEASTETMPRTKVRISNSKLSPSIARWNRIPNRGIQFQSNSSSHLLCCRKSARRYPRTQRQRMRSKSRLTATREIHRAAGRLLRATSHASSPPTRRMTMSQSRIIGTVPPPVRSLCLSRARRVPPHLPIFREAQNAPTQPR